MWRSTLVTMLGTRTSVSPQSNTTALTASAWIDRYQANRQRFAGELARGFGRVCGIVDRAADDRIEIAAGRRCKRVGNRASERADARDEQRGALIFSTNQRA